MQKSVYNFLTGHPVGLAIVLAVLALLALYLIWRLWWCSPRLQRKRWNQRVAKAACNVPFIPRPTDDDLLVDCESSWAFPLPTPVVTEGIPEEPPQMFLEEPDPRLGAEASVRFPH